MSDALSLAVRSGLVGHKGIKVLSATSTEACSRCREGRAFHVRVTKETPLYVWSSFSSAAAEPPPMNVSGEAGGDGDGASPIEKSEEKATAGGGIEPSSDKGIYVSSYNIGDTPFFVTKGSCLRGWKRLFMQSSQRLHVGRYRE